MADVLTLWRRASILPFGDRLFSTLVGLRAPYFRSVRPRFTVLEPHHVTLVVRDRRRVHNHLGTVHAIALCNGLEAAMGALAEVTIAADRRWIPQRMQVAYTAKATGDVTCVAQTSPDDWSGPAPGEVPVQVHGELTDGTVVVEGVITLWVTPRRQAG
jgi:acyl-coenzyme A thioesterase PaaI-like protein